MRTGWIRCKEGSKKEKWVLIERSDRRSNREEQEQILKSIRDSLHFNSWDLTVKLLV